ncbi:PucR family transcriptional regulator [Planococcus salinus]|uniref:PucR family transcriptional regulator n=1 Tax=Planococcus salinus TaxID=1848460 RepID=A0A3M8P7Z0_9BACL|nr:PucR family transcriptional regulator [Planococcus salinus]RNF39742.1 PucR family transcriptional regulator [Planococcus salinus]
MGISLRNAMKLGKFNECKVVAGHEGLTRMVEVVTIMEVPEVVQWLKGKELILTSLFAIKDDIEAQNMLVQHLHSAGATALAIKPSQFIEKIPEGIIDSGNKLGFPIIEIPDPVKYLDILSPVMHYIFNDKVVLQEDLEQASKVLHEISLSAQGIQEFLNNVSYLTKNVITIESEFSFVDVPEPPVEISALNEAQVYELSIIQRPLHFKRKYDGRMVSSIAAPIMNDGEYYGNITCWEVNNENLPIDLAILEKASSLLSLEFLKLRVKYEIEQQYKRDFIRELLFSENIKEKNIIEWGDKYHITRDADYVSLLLSFQDGVPYEENNMQMKDYQVDAAVRKIHPSALVGHLKNGICIILPVEEGQSSRLYEQIHDVLAKETALGMPLLLGVGRPGKGPEGIQNSYAQAEKAIDLNKTINRPEGIYYYDALGAYRLLDQLKEEKELKDFYSETVGRLIEQDTNHELIKTLKAYFFHDEVLKSTAEALFIHINTLKYRMKKIEEITACSLKSSEGKMNLFLGLKIHELLYQNEK